MGMRMGWDGTWTRMGPSRTGIGIARKEQLLGWEWELGEEGMGQYMTEWGQEWGGDEDENGDRHGGRSRTGTETGIGMG